MADAWTQPYQQNYFQQAQTVGPGTTTRSRGKCSGKGLRAGRLRVKAETLVVPARAAAFSAFFLRTVTGTYRFHPQSLMPVPSAAQASRAA